MSGTTRTFTMLLMLA